MDKEKLTKEEKISKAREILPLLKGLTVQQALDVLMYAKEEVRAEGVLL